MNDSVPRRMVAINGCEVWFWRIYVVPASGFFYMCKFCGYDFYSFTFLPDCLVVSLGKGSACKATGS